MPASLRIAHPHDPLDPHRQDSATPYRSPARELWGEAGSDFVWLWLQTGESAYADLYRGVCVSELSATAAGAAIDWSLRTPLLVAAVDRAHRLSDAQRDRLALQLDLLHEALPARMDELRRVRVLFIGDCLLEEAALFLAARALGSGLALDAHHIVSRNPLEQRKRLRALAGVRFDAAFYSPFTYGFNRDFARVLRTSHALAGRAVVDDIVADATRGVAHTIDMLATALDCPVFVSNASTLQRGTTVARRVVKSAATARVRRLARTAINRWLPEHLERHNRGGDGHLHLLDEESLTTASVHQRGLGAYLYLSDSLHPTVFSHRLAGVMAERLEAAALRGRKVVVFEGTSTSRATGPDGAQLPLAGRESASRRDTLARLTRKGVLLAVASTGGRALAASPVPADPGLDPVAEETGPEPLAHKLARIHDKLGLSIKDYVFIGADRADRAMVGSRWPMMHVADASDPRTWRVLALWADMLDEHQELDRTRLYRERDARAAALRREDGAGDETEMFARLGLKATLVHAGSRNVRRVCELINRTNQWNLTGSRTTPQQVEEWCESDSHSVLAVQVEDRVGPMGTVCTVVARYHADHLEIVVFALSCRVFGFGVETLILGHLKELARARYGEPRLRGAFVPTALNAPCRFMYAEHGYVPVDDAWEYRGSPDETPLPKWFSLAGFAV